MYHLHTEMFVTLYNSVYFFKSINLVMFLHMGTRQISEVMLYLL